MKNYDARSEYRLFDDNIAIDLHHFIVVIGFSWTLCLLSNTIVATLRKSQTTITIPFEHSGNISIVLFFLVLLCI